MQIYLFEKDEETIIYLKKFFKGKNELKKIVNSEEELMLALNDEKIDILLINLNELSITLQKKITENAGYLIVFSRETTAAGLKKALELRANDYLSLPLNEEELENALLKAEKYLQENVREKKQHQQGKVISFLSSKGGVGKSVLAVNLAHLLYKKLSAKVIVIDTVTRFGGVDILLDINEKKSMATIPVTVENKDNYWAEVQHSVVSIPGKIDVLLAGDKHEDAISVEKIKNIVGVLRDKYDYIVIDSENSFNEMNVSLLEISDLSIFVSTSDLSALKNLKLGLETLKSYYYSMNKVKIVINRFDKLNELTVTELEKFLKYKIALLVPEDRETVLRSINKGEPFSDGDMDTPLCQALHRMIDCIQGKSCELADEEKNGKSGWLKNLLGGGR